MILSRVVTDLMGLLSCESPFLKVLASYYTWQTCFLESNLHGVCECEVSLLVVPHLLHPSTSHGHWELKGWFVSCQLHSEVSLSVNWVAIHLAGVVLNKRI